MNFIKYTGVLAGMMEIRLLAEKTSLGFFKKCKFQFRSKYFPNSMKYITGK